MSFPVIAPTLAPPPAGSLARGLAAALMPHAFPDALTGALSAMFPSAQVRLFDSGRAALAEALRLAMQATGRRRVVLPAYTSYSVAAAAVAAGADAVLCDVDPSTLALDHAALRACVDERTAAVVLGNLFGWPEPTDDLGWLKQLGVVLVDDAAQALGSREQGGLAGGRGGLGVLSFGRGKCVTLGDAGALLVSDPALRNLASLPPAEGRGLRPLALAFGVSVSRSRWMLGVLSRLPGIGLGESHFEPVFASRPAPASVRAMATGLSDTVDRMRTTRRAVAVTWRERLAPIGALSLPPDAAPAEPAFLRYPVLATTPAMRERSVAALAEAGFGYVRSYPSALGGIPAFATTVVDRTPTPGAHLLADCLIALPCHVGVGRRDIDRAVAALEAANA